MMSKPERNNGGGTYGQDDFAGSAQRSKTAPKPPEGPLKAPPGGENPASVTGSGSAPAAQRSRKATIRP
jgi:hypothetical protein